MNELWDTHCVQHDFLHLSIPTLSITFAEVINIDNKEKYVILKKRKCNIEVIMYYVLKNKEKIRYLR